MFKQFTEYIDNIFAPLLISFFIGVFVGTLAANNKWEKNLEKVNLSIKTHHSEIDGVKSNWVEVVNIKKNK